MTNEQTFGFVSVNALRQFLKLAQARDLDIDELCRDAGLPVDVLQGSGGQIQGWQFQRFLNVLLEATADPLLGLHVGDFVEPGSYSVLGYITMSCTTLGEAVERIAPYEKLVGDRA